MTRGVCTLAVTVESRAATSEADLKAAVAIMTTAFANDAVWGGWAFPIADPVARRMAHERWWRFNLASATRYPWVRLTPNDGAATLWIPPGGAELTPEEEEQLEPLLRELVGAHAAPFLEGLELFGSNHPRGEPHYYLSLLGTHDRFRGHGLGMALLTENLARIDGEGLPCYLESTNPGNIPRYESMGFRKIGAFKLPADGPTVDTMWRDARRSTL